MMIIVNAIYMAYKLLIRILSYGNTKSVNISVHIISAGLIFQIIFILYTEYHSVVHKLMFLASWQSDVTFLVMNDILSCHIP